MRRTTLHTFAVGFLLGLAPAALVCCGGQTDLGTETGNPPAIDSLKLYLEQDANGVRVVGAPGAITPAGARVTVRNLSTGESVEASASADGSLDVSIAGAPGDEYEVTVSSGGQEVSQPVSFVEIARRQDLAGVSCQALEATLLQTLSTTYSSADATCAVDADCAYAGWGQGECYYQCGETLLSRSGGAAARASAEQQTAAVCAALDNCERFPPSSCGGGRPFELLECIEGQCRATDPATLSCDDLLIQTSGRYAELLAAADRTCAGDGDCRRVGMSAACLSCVSSVAISQSAALGLQELVRVEVDQGLCQALSNRACSLPEAGCIDHADYDALCIAGTCTLVAPPEPLPPE
jgi:hypothetical protein